MKLLTNALALVTLLSVCGCYSSTPPQEGSSTSVRQGGREKPEAVPTVVGHFEAIAGTTSSPVDAFDYEITLESVQNDDYFMQWEELLLTVQSTKQMLSHHGSSRVEFSLREGPGLIDITATQVDSGPLNVGGDARMTPEKWFELPLKTLSFPKDRPVYLRLRFRDADEYYALTVEPGKGLRLVRVKANFGTIRNDSISKFTILEAREGERVFQCDNLSVFAREGQKTVWSRHIPLGGAPKEFRVVGKTLFVLSTEGHSLYVRKSDGKIIFYHDKPLAGKSPWDEILVIAQRDYTEADPWKGTELSGYMASAALLEEKRAAPFLMECIEKGYGLTERWYAVAVLEHLNGNSVLWKQLREGQPWDPVDEERGPWSIDRVYPDAAARAEVQKWEKVFGKLGKPLLTRPLAGQ
jgi:hypothetical protein